MPAVCRLLVAGTFLLTPLREGRPGAVGILLMDKAISTHAPAGGATQEAANFDGSQIFLLTPLREGRQISDTNFRPRHNFYSRPCGRGDGLRGLIILGAV